MKSMYQMVQEFHRKFNLPAPEKPTLGEFRKILRFNLIFEELMEYAEAAGLSVTFDEYNEPIVEDVGPIDWPEVIDAHGDLKYVVEGGFVEMGVNPRPYDEEIHRTNMLKEGGPMKDGKILKPPGWEKPRLGEMLERELAEKHYRYGLFKVRGLWHIIRGSAGPYGALCGLKPAVMPYWTAETTAPDDYELCRKCSFKRSDLWMEARDG